ncbi:hypothetical protein D3C71_1957580 [compost metagenome]
MDYCYRENIRGRALAYGNRGFHRRCFHCFVGGKRKHRLRGIHYGNLLHACGCIAIFISGRPCHFCRTQCIVGWGVAGYRYFVNVCACCLADVHKGLQTGRF